MSENFTKFLYDINCTKFLEEICLTSVSACATASSKLPILMYGAANIISSAQSLIVDDSPDYLCYNVDKGMTVGFFLSFLLYFTPLVCMINVILLIYALYIVMKCYQM